MIIDHTHPEYQKRWKLAGDNRWNGAFYYSEEIVKNIIPMVKTDRNWVTINIPGTACEHSIVFIHNNLDPAKTYSWLRKYKDLVLVCGLPETVPKVSHLGRAIYLPLSVDVNQVRRFQTKKTKYLAYAGRPTKANAFFPPETEFLQGMPRAALLGEIAKYEYIYAVGRTAIEAKILGCEVLRYDVRFPDPDLWQILDNKDAARLLQEKLDDLSDADQYSRNQL